MKALEGRVSLGPLSGRQAGMTGFCRATYRRPPLVTLCWAQKYATVGQDLSVAAWCRGVYVGKLNDFLIDIGFASGSTILFSKASSKPRDLSFHIPHCFACLLSAGRICPLWWEPSWASLGLEPSIPSQLLEQRSKEWHWES